MKERVSRALTQLAQFCEAAITQLDFPMPTDPDAPRPQFKGKALRAVLKEARKAYANLDDLFDKALV